MTGFRPGAWRAPLGCGRPGSACPGPLLCGCGAGPCRPSRECNKAREGGSNSLDPGGYAPGGGRDRRRPEASPYTAALVTRRPIFGCLFEIVETLVLTLIIFFVIQTFIAQPYKVQQQSMEHTLEPDQYVLVDKLTPRFDTYKRGDIVVFTPPDRLGPGGRHAVHQAGHRARRRDGRDPRRSRLHQRHRARRAVRLRPGTRRPAATDDRPGR